MTDDVNSYGGTVGSLKNIATRNMSIALQTKAYNLTVFACILTNSVAKLVQLLEFDWFYHLQ